MTPAIRHDPCHNDRSASGQAGRTRFDVKDEGLSQAWQNGEATFPLAITVPFPWGSKLSGLPGVGPAMSERIIAKLPFIHRWIAVMPLS